MPTGVSVLNPHASGGSGQSNREHRLDRGKAGNALFLASDMASYVTRVVLDFAGGQEM